MRIMRGLILLLATIVVPTLVSAQTYPTNDGSPEQSQARPLRRGDRDQQHAHGVVRRRSRRHSTRRAGLKFINSDLAFGTQLRLPGQLRRLHDLGHHRPRQAGRRVGRRSASRRRAIRRSTATCSSCPPRARATATIAATAACRIRRTTWPACASSTCPTRRRRSSSRTCRRAKARTRTRSCRSPKDKNIIYLYVSGQQAARPETELAGCKNGTDPADPTNSLYQLDIIKVPLDNPEKAAVIPGARIFTGLDGRGRVQAVLRARQTRAGTRRAPRVPPSGAAHPEMPTHRAAQLPRRDGVSGDEPARGLLLDALHRRRHLEPREAGPPRRAHGYEQLPGPAHGGVQQRRQEADPDRRVGRRHGPDVPGVEHDRARRQHDHHARREEEADAARLLQAARRRSRPRRTACRTTAASSRCRDATCTCRAGIRAASNVMDFTDPDKAFEIGVLRSRLHRSADGRSTCPQPQPVDAARSRRRQRTIGGSWGAYYWNGLIYSSELDRGMDILELTPSAHLSANEIAAAKLVRFNEYNPQSQPKMTWPPAFVVVRSYLDQLVRGRRARVGAHGSDLLRARRGGEEDRRGACNGAERARAAGGQGRRRCEGRCARAYDGRRDPASRGGVEVSRRPSHERQRAP